MAEWMPSMNNNYVTSNAVPYYQNAAGPDAGQGTGDNSWFNKLIGSMFDKTNTDGSKTGGWGNLGINLGSAIYNGWMANKQLGLAEDSLDFQKNAFQQNFDKQNELVERAWNDRLAARTNSQ